MRLKRRGGGPEETKDVASFQQEGRGVRVFDVEGKDIGYFGPEEYEKIIIGGRKPAEGERDGLEDGGR
jgi:hypothetical protein